MLMRNRLRNFSEKYPDSSDPRQSRGLDYVSRSKRLERGR